MPHLAPLSWIVAVVLFWSLIFTMMVVVWWMQLPKFSGSNVKVSKTPYTLWKWS